MKNKLIISLLTLSILLASCQSPTVIAPTPTPAPTLEPKIAKWSNFGPGWTYFTEHSQPFKKGKFTPEGNLWLVTDSSVYYWDFKAQTAQRYHACGKENEVILNLSLDLQNNLWILTGSSIVFWDLKKMECRIIDPWQAIPPSDSRKDQHHGSFMDIAMTPDGMIWISTSGSEILRFANGLWSQENCSQMGGEFYVGKDGRLIIEHSDISIRENGQWKMIRWGGSHNKSYFVEDQDGHLWVTVDPCCQSEVPNRVIYYTGIDWVEVAEAFDTSLMVQKGSDGLWFNNSAAGKQGIWKYDGKEWSYIYKGNVPGWLMITANDDIWSFSGYVGVYHLREGVWKSFSVPAGLLIDDWHSFAFGKSPEGSLFLPAETSGKLARFDNETQTVFFSPAPENISDGAVFPLRSVKTSSEDSYFVSEKYLIKDLLDGLVFGPDGDLWVGYHSGVARLDGKTWKYYYGPDYGLTRLAFDSSGTLWIDGPQGRSSLKNERWQVEAEYETDPPRAPSTVLIVSDGTAWSPEDLKRLNILPDSSGQNYVLESDGRSPIYVWKLIKDHAGTVWASTDAGIVRFDGKEWHISLANGAYAIAVGSGNLIWADDDYYYGGKISYFDGQAWQPYPGDPNDLLLSDSDGGAWIVKNTAPAGTDQKTNRLLCRASITPSVCYPVEAEVYDLAVAPDGALWMLLGRRNGQNESIGLARYMPDKW
jgi:ligand-binding sensor domain-containing protein